VAGILVELVALDDGDNPASSATRALEFGVDTDVMGVVGPFSEATVLAAAPVYDEMGLAMITPATCSTSLADEREGAAFCLGANADTLGGALLERVPVESQIVLLSSPGRALEDRLSRAASRVVEDPWSEETLLQLAARRADLYLYAGDALPAADLLSRMRNAGIDAPLWGGPSLARTQLAQVAGNAVAGTCYAFTAPLLADLSAGSAYASYYREAASTTPGPWAALANDAALLLLDALEEEVKELRAPTRAGVIHQLVGRLDKDGRPLFSAGERRNPDVVLYCYGAEDLYPGQIVEP